MKILGSVFVYLMLSGSLCSAVFEQSMFDDNEIVKVSVDQSRSLYGGLSLSFDSQNRGLRNLDLNKEESVLGDDLGLTRIDLNSDGRLEFTDVPHNVNISQFNDNIYSNILYGSVLHIEGDHVFGLLSSDLNIRSLGDGNHLIQKVERPTGKMCGTVDTPNRLHESTFSSSHGTRNSVSIYPELITFVDSTSYGFIINHSPWSTEPASKVLVWYTTLFWSSVKLAFKTLDPYCLTVRLKLNKIYHFNTKESEAYIFDPAMIDNDPNKIDLEKMIASFGKALYTHRSKLANHDFAYFQIGREMYFDNEESFGGSVASIPCACKPFEGTKSVRVAVGEDKWGMFTGVHLAAHECGHVLGAQHDTSKFNNCPAVDTFIMSQIWPPYRSPNFFLFSSCTANHIKSFVSGQSAACISNTTSGTLKEYPLPGEFYDAKKQCDRFYYGSGYTPAVQGIDLCRHLICRRNSIIKKFYRIPALQGTSCGDGKMCRQGVCV